MRDKILDESKRVFKPEFLNRLDDMIVFHQLERNDLVKFVVGADDARWTTCRIRGALLLRQTVSAHQQIDRFLTNNQLPKNLEESRSDF